MNKEDFDYQSVSPKTSETKQALKTPELEAILDSTNTTIWTIDTNYCLTYGNKLYFDECFNSINRNIEIGEKVIFQEFDEKFKSEWKGYFDRALKGEKFSIERKRQFSKTTKWSAYHFGPLTNAKGKITGASVVAHNITDRVKAKSALKKSDERFKDFVEMLPEAIFEVDENLKITYANKMAFELFGYNEDDIKSGLFALEMLAPEERKRASEIFVNRLKNIDPGTLEYVALKKDGTKFPILFHASIIIENNVVKGARGIIVDISERKKSEAKQMQMALMLDLAPSSIIIHDFDGKILYANKKTFELHGYSEKEFKTLNLHDFDSAESREKIKERIDWIKNNGHSNFLVKHIKKDGSSLPLDVKTIITKWNDQDVILSVGTDLTELKIQENAVKESEEKLKAIIENSPDSIFLVSKSGNFLFANQSASKILGYTQEELLKLKVTDIGEPNGPESRFDELIQSGKYYGEMNLRRKDGSHVVVDINAIVLPNGLIYGSCRDLTDRKEVEKKLQKSYNLLNHVTEMVPGAVFQYRLYPDGHSSFPYASSGIEKIYELTPDQIKNDASSVFKLFHPSDYDNIIKTINESSEKQSIFRHEYRVILPKQGLKWRLCEAKPELLKDGSTLWYGVITDITERKAVEQELRANQNFLYETQKIAHLGNYKMNILTGEWECSEVMNHILGIDKTYKKNVESWLDIVHPDWKQIMKDYLINDVIGKNSEFNKAYKIIRKSDNEERWLHGLGRLVKNNNGDLVEMIGTIQDITDIKTIQEELTNAKEKAEESDRLKSAFLANMSHEIRTPMNGILGFASLLKEAKLSGEEQKKYIDIIEKSGERMLNTINDIIDISKIESGLIEVNYTDFMVDEILDNIYSFFKPETDAKGMVLKSNNQLTGKENLIHSDKEKINAILINLVKNAIKYCDKGEIEIGCKPKTEFLEFYVKDTGRGIPNHRQRAIFDRFVQADIDDKEAIEGSGLGLAISKSYIELLGGMIWVESRKDIGSTFYFTVPFKSAQKVEDKSVIMNTVFENSSKKINILIVEDDNVSELLTRTMIENVSHNIFTVKNGNEAVEFCKNNPDIDLVLMDIKMPVLDGYQATRKIREFNKELVIIATTAFALTGDREKALEAGCNDYLSKPLSNEKLLKLIKHYFS